MLTLGDYIVNRDIFKHDNAYPMPKYLEGKCEQDKGSDIDINYCPSSTFQGPKTKRGQPVRGHS